MYVVISSQRFPEFVGYLFHFWASRRLTPITDSTGSSELDSFRYTVFRLLFAFQFLISLIPSLLLLQSNVCFCELKLHGFIVTDKPLSATSTHWSVLMFISRFGHCVQIQRVSGVSELHVPAVIMSLKRSTLIHCSWLLFITPKLSAGTKTEKSKEINLYQHINFARYRSYTSLKDNSCQAKLFNSI